MAEYILQILRSQLMVVFSWGFNSPTSLPCDKGLAFRVDGLDEYKVLENYIAIDQSSLQKKIVGND